MPSDNHVHTSFSSDSDTPMEEMLKQAIQSGFSSVCFTDHMDYDFPDMGNGMTFLFDTEEYLLEINRLADKYPQIQIRRGIELGLKPDIKEKCNSLTSSLPLDFVIGSTHLVDDQDPYYPVYWEGKTEKQGIDRFYEITLENIRAGIDFDVYGHIDYIIRYTPTQQEYRSKGIQNEEYMKKCLQDSFDIIDEILRLLIESGKGIELNTSGLKYGLGHPHPHEEILKRYRELGGEIITIGSDGHQPAHLAYDFAKVPELLRTCNFSYYTEFHHRKPEMIRL
ncbi:MAG: histidinol-phosphatase HisJ family protein [Lachnospiraceae bacterium]|nr:histidinol-phosphatase HisJ family protein [Lachnospiraceae bacterium]